MGLRRGGCTVPSWIPLAYLQTHHHHQRHLSCHPWLSSLPTETKRNLRSGTIGSWGQYLSQCVLVCAPTCPFLSCITTETCAQAQVSAQQMCTPTLRCMVLQETGVPLARDHTESPGEGRIRAELSLGQSSTRRGFPPHAGYLRAGGRYLSSSFPIPPLAAVGTALMHPRGLPVLSGFSSRPQRM